MAVSRLSIVKFLELALAIACVVLHYKSLGERDAITQLLTRGECSREAQSLYKTNQQQHQLLTSGTFVGYSVILIALFAGYLLSNPINKKLDMFFSLIGCAMFIASGVLILKEWENSIWNSDTKKIAISKGSLAIVNGVLFLFDAVFTLRD